MGEELYTARFGADATSLLRTLDAMNRKTETVGEVFTALGARLSAVGSQIGGAFRQVSANATRTAGDIEEMRSLLAVTFGSMVQTVEKWATEHARLINRSRFDLMRYAGDIKVLLTSMGIGSKEATKLSKALVVQAEDWASLRNLRVDEVLGAMQSGLVGMARPLYRFGVILTEANVQNRIMADGTVKTKKEITGLQKVMARAQMILEGLPEAYGDAERTARSYVNQIKGLEAAVTDLNVAIGDQLMPIEQQLLALKIKLTRATENFVKALDPLPAYVIEGTKAIGGIIEKLGEFSWSIGRILLTLKLLSGAFVAMGIKAGALTGIFKVVGAALAALATAVDALKIAVFAVGAAVGWLVGKVTGFHKWLGDLIFRLMASEEVLKEFEEGSRAIAGAVTEMHEAGKAAESVLGDVGIAVSKATGGFAELTGVLTSATTELAGIEKASASFSKGFAKVLRDLRYDAMTETEAMRAQFAEAQTGMEVLMKRMAGGEVTQKTVEESLGYIRKLAKLSPEKLAAAMKEAEASTKATLKDIAQDYATAVHELNQVGLDPERFAESLKELEEVVFEPRRREALLPTPEEVEIYRTRLTDLIKSYGETVQAHVGETKERWQEQIDGAKQQWKTLEEWVGTILTNIQARMQFKFRLDTKEFHEALAEADKKLQALVQMAQNIPLGTAVSPQTGPVAGPGGDRLSVWTTRRHGARSEANVTNINATWNIARAEPPRAMAKMIAGEVARLRRRGQVPGGI